MDFNTVTENKLNNRNNENILILNRSFKNFIKLVIVYSLFLQNFFKSFCFRNLEKFISKFKFFKRFIKDISKNYKRKNIEKVFFPYEAQPHQQFFVKELKKNNNKLKIIGYMHTVIPPFLLIT